MRTCQGHSVRTARAVLPPPRPHGGGTRGRAPSQARAVTVTSPYGSTHVRLRLLGSSSTGRPTRSLLMDATIDPAFFHSIQILRSAEVLTANGGPPNPQQVALAIYRASASDTRSSEQYMALRLPSASQAKPRKHEISLPMRLHCRTRRADPMDQGGATEWTQNFRDKGRDRGRAIKVHVSSSSSHGTQVHVSHTQWPLGGHLCFNLHHLPDHTGQSCVEPQSTAPFHKSVPA